MDLQLTVIVPIYNEEECLPMFFKEFDRFLAATDIQVHALLVDDGSNDNSLQRIMEKCAAAPAHYDYLSFSSNCGLSSAIKAGFDACTTELVGYIDADLQAIPMDFLNYLEFFPEFDMVNGIREKRRDTLVKRLSSRFANAYRRFMIGDDIVDTCCPLKILKTSYAKKIPFFSGMHRFIPALVQLEGGRVKQVPIAHFPRFAGAAKYNLLNRLVGPFFDLLAFRWMRSRHIDYVITSRNQ
jgi:glycosyltransferase involved in cell wall biosynthesis